jgi:hypothetical protein
MLLSTVGHRRAISASICYLASGGINHLIPPEIWNLETFYLFLCGFQLSVDSASNMDKETSVVDSVDQWLWKDCTEPPYSDSFLVTFSIERSVLEILQIFPG